MGEVIDNNRVKKLRLRIENEHKLYPGMKSLKIRGKDLGELPAEIFNVTELEVLDLSPERESCLYYRVPKIPSSIGRLINLRILMLDTNELKEVPPEIGLLSNLEKVSLSNNDLKSIPEGFRSLKCLRSLHAANNQIEDFPKQLCELRELRFLDLSDNKLVSVPDSIRKMQGLESLLLFINQISVLPDGICELVNLRTFWLGKNRLKRLPRNFTNLKNLDWGFRHTESPILEGNPLVYPPTEIAKKGIEYIERYFQQSEPATNNQQRVR